MHDYIKFWIIKKKVLGSYIHTETFGVQQIVMHFLNVPAMPTDTHLGLCPLVPPCFITSTTEYLSHCHKSKLNLVALLFLTFWFGIYFCWLKWFGIYLYIHYISQIIDDVTFFFFTLLYCLSNNKISVY